MQGSKGVFTGWFSPWRMGGVIKGEVRDTSKTVKCGKKQLT